MTPPKVTVFALIYSVTPLHFSPVFSTYLPYFVYNTVLCIFSILFTIKLLYSMYVYRATVWCQWRHQCLLAQDLMYLTFNSNLTFQAFSTFSLLKLFFIAQKGQKSHKLPRKGVAKLWKSEKVYKSPKKPKILVVQFPDILKVENTVKNIITTGVTLQHSLITIRR